MGFTALYETGRIEAVTVSGGEGTSGIQDTKELLKSIRNLERKSHLLQKRVFTLDKGDGWQIFVKQHTGRTITLEVFPTDSIDTIKLMLENKTDVEHFP
jgi:hypothetical protein